MKEKERKIIEIYVTEEGEDESSFNVKRCENTEVANFMMKIILKCLYADLGNDICKIDGIETDN